MIHVADGAAQERAKYAEIWSSIPEYRDYSPGLVNVERFMSVMNPPKHSTLVDIGCGAGVAGLEFEKHGLRVCWVDITDAGLVPDVNRTRFVQAPLWTDWARIRPHGWDYGFCCDVMEHIPPEYTMLVLDRMIAACHTLWLQIALRPDQFGKAIGQPLHLTVQSFDWWLVRLATLGKVTDARDLCGDGMYVVERA